MEQLFNPMTRPLVRLAATVLVLCAWPQVAKAEHLCSFPSSKEEIVAEVIGPGAGYYLCEWIDVQEYEPQDVSPMRYWTPEQWQEYNDGAAVETAMMDEKERILLKERYRKLQQGMWFMPDEEPFAGWRLGSPKPSPRPANHQGSGCTISYWTTDGAVIMSTLGKGDGIAVISYMGYSIPAPKKSKSRRIALTQSGKTQNVVAFVSAVGRGKKKMGMVSFAVQSSAILVGAIEDEQDYSLADKGKTIFSGKWHGGLSARDALGRCIAQRR